MSQTNSALMSIITQYTKQFVDRISELENANHQLKLQLSNSSTVNKADFDRLAERHNELKNSYAEIERENAKLRQDMEQLVEQQNSLQTDISQYFQQMVSNVNKTSVESTMQTPKKSPQSNVPSDAPSQTPIYRNAKATTKLLNTEYESDSDLSDSDDEMPGLIGESKLSPRKLRFNREYDKTPELNKSFVKNSTVPTKSTQSTSPNLNTLNLSGILPKDEAAESDNDDYESILKHIITEGLMNGLENLNRSPQSVQFKGFGPSTSTPRPESRMGKRPKSDQVEKNLSKRQTCESTQLSGSNKPEQVEQSNTGPFGFMFRPQQMHTQNQPQSNGTGQPASDEAQLIQKILETIFTPPKKQ